MAVTILGQHVSTIRPHNIAPFGIRRKDRPRPRYDKAYQSKTIKENSGKVVSVIVRLKNGGIRGIARGLHSDVLEMFDIKPEEVAKVGWELENGNYIWR